VAGKEHHALAVHEVGEGAAVEQAERLAAPIDLRRLHMALNLDSPVPTDDEAAGHRYTTEERRYVMGQRPRAVIGSPKTCRDALEAMASRYEADEMTGRDFTDLLAPESKRVVLDYFESLSRVGASRRTSTWISISSRGTPPAPTRSTTHTHSPVVRASLLMARRQAMG